jgi:hypothetical protein
MASVTVDHLQAALVSVTALRVFAPDVRRAVRLLLRAGVRVGMNEILESPPPVPRSAPPASSCDEEA